MVRLAVILLVASWLIMYLTWRWGIQRCLQELSLPPSRKSFLLISMIQDVSAVYRQARKYGIWPLSLKLYLAAAFIALASLIVPAGRLILTVDQ